MLDITQVDHKNVWKIVMQIRKSFFSLNIDPKCQHVDPFLFDSFIKDNIDNVAEKLKVNTTIRVSHGKETKRRKKQPYKEILFY